jgi:DNA polymerase-3 subunit epsilon
MKYAIIDTETSGLFDFSKPADAPGQPRLASLAVILAEIETVFGPMDNGIDRLAVTHECEIFVRPFGWEMTPEGTAVHGLTQEFLLENGQPIATALDYYTSLVRQGYIICAYNAQFDTKMLRGELRRAERPDLFEQTKNICLMRAATPVCRIPKKSGTGLSWKFPKLSEACAFFEIAQPAAHSALGDARSAFTIMQHLHKANLLPAPEVHFAKNKPDAIAATK